MTSSQQVGQRLLDETQKARTTNEKMDKLVISTLKLVPMKTPHEENEDSKKKKPHKTEDSNYRLGANICKAGI